MMIVCEYVAGGSEPRRESVSTNGLLWITFELADGSAVTVKPDDDATGLEINSPTGRLRVNPVSANGILIETVRFGSG